MKKNNQQDAEKKALDLTGMIQFPIRKNTFGELKETYSNVQVFQKEVRKDKAVVGHNTNYLAGMKDTQEIFSNEYIMALFWTKQNEKSANEVRVENGKTRFEILESEIRIAKKAGNVKEQARLMAQATQVLAERIKANELEQVELAQSQG